MLNLHIFPPRNLNSTNSNISSHQRALWREQRTWGISLRIYLAVLHRWHFPLKRLRLPKLAIEVKYMSLNALLLHLEFKYYFYKSNIISSRWHPWWELDVFTFQWQVNCWIADRRHQRHISRLRHPSPPPPPRLPPGSLCRQFFFRLRRFFSPFSPNAEPGPRLAGNIRWMAPKSLTILYI